MLLERLGKELLIFDGAMGTQLQVAGLKGGDIPEELNITNPELIQDIHVAYLNAGADFISTNTFGCNPLKMEESKYKYTHMIKAAVENAKIAQQKANRVSDSYIALDIGPIGQLLEPAGTLTFDEAYTLVKQQVEVVKDEVDVVLLETMSDLYEVKAAILAVKENSDLPVFVTMTFEQNRRSLTGTNPETFVNVVEGLGVDALGVNCSLGPEELKPIIEELLATASVPVMIQPNAGLPTLESGETVYHLQADEFSNYLIDVLNDGVAIVGGCCGTTPAFIEELKKLNVTNVKQRSVESLTKVSSHTQTVTITNKVVVCGERLNPTGKKKLKKALLEEHYDEVLVEAIAQEQAGADILDVNVGVPGIDEVAVMTKVIKMIQEVINLPLQIDSSSADAIEQACRYYNGKPLINSVNGKEEVMRSIFPIVKKYGGTVIGLTLDNEIPLTAEERVDIAKRIIETAKEYGIDKKDIIIDCLTLTASAQQKEVKETLKAVEMVNAMGVSTVLGVSNVSFGLPNRALLNRTFLTLAMNAGLNLPIINPLDNELMGTIDAFNVINYIDIDSEHYINKQSNQSKEQKVTATKTDFTLSEIIKKGLKEEVVEVCKKELETKEPLTVVNEIIIPALNIVGEEYEKGIIFLPQLIQSAETTKKAFEVVQSCFETDKSQQKGPIVLATVEGDIHDIGKNIVKVVLESYGYQVIDLGKNVPVQTVVDAYKEHQPKAIGLSALMTTTVLSMKKTIEALKEEGNVCPILVGGAVLTADIASDIGADYYCKDAMETVQTLNSILK
ncbi:homocysteine S-methyltransferase family protein [Breznakia pachnodae]|uniref:Methionine synthase n=1 Tax=Breznakia pachnodae TaxID=265178 RepID=A0ABU0E4G9_9FIRM|nr:homocysteine S-methyltransferase family protein [Breznakia pachnodae]MDQ0361780.1 5-methyltetrahydrofolate--homocysteine methyltransferase [Breznakia pachnodae]